uniref:Hypotheticial protein n=1 Tax=Schistosoma japonicum TaxID=6182 RepID=C1LNQ5_SCHJA|nr:hypotheticial protein [Schistosoma japonicum]
MARRPGYNRFGLTFLDVNYDILGMIMVNEPHHD